MTLEEKITMLTAKWYRYVNIDHHKDRDCHLYIEKVWSYGDEPYYIAYHHGYIADDWTSPKCATEEMAQTFLHNKLEKLLITEIKRLQGLDEEELNWQGITKEKRDQLVKELSVVFDKA